MKKIHLSFSYNYSGHHLRWRPCSTTSLLGIILLLFICYSSVISAQTSTYQPLEWGSVPAEDLQMTVYTPDTTAMALVLGDEGYMTVRKVSSGKIKWTLLHHKRIKILSTAALEEYADIAIYYYHKDRSDKLKKISAQTIAPDGTISTVSEEEILYEELNEYWSKATFSFPKVTVGSIVEYRYEHTSDRVSSPPKWSFRGPVPVRSSFFHFTNTPSAIYTPFLQGTEYMAQNKNQDGEDSYQFGDTQIDFNDTQYWLQHGEAVKEEPFMTTPEDYYINLRFQPRVIMASNGMILNFDETWERTNRELLKNRNLGLNFLDKKQYRSLLKAANNTIDPTATQKDLLYAINRFITKEITWSERYSIWSDQSPDEAYLKHEGSTADIQYAAIALLREYGIKAHPVLLSTRNNGAMIQSFPFIRQFNYVVVIAEVNNLFVLVDFTDPMLKPGIIREEALNGAGFMLHEKKPSWISIGLPIAQDAFRWNGQILADGSLQGEMKASMTTLSARPDRLMMKDKPLEEVWIDRLPNGANWTELVAENENDIQENLVVIGKFEIPEAGFVNENFLYISPIIHTNFKTNPLRLEKRDYPVDFPYSFEKQSIYQYKLPEGYKVEALPENINIILPNSDAIYQYMASEKNNKINIISTFKVSKTRYLPEEYPALRELFASAVQKMQEQIVLKKVE